MNGKTIKVLSVIAGVLLIAAGVVCLMNQDVAVLSAGVLIGIFMLCSGILEVVMFSYGRKLMLGSGWLLLDGILTVLLSLFLLFNQAFTMVYLPYRNPRPYLLPRLLRRCGRQKKCVSVHRTETLFLFPGIFTAW